MNDTRHALGARRAQNAIAMPAIESDPDRERRRRRQDAPLEVADVQVLAVHRRAGLAHLRAEHHAHGLLVVAHRQRHAEVADHRRHDVAVPGAVGVPDSSGPRRRRMPPA